MIGPAPRPLQVGTPPGMRIWCRTPRKAAAARTGDSIGAHLASATRRGGVRGRAVAVLHYRTLSNRTVAMLAVERDMVFWDRALTGFWVRVYPTECRDATIRLA